MKRITVNVVLAVMGIAWFGYTIMMFLVATALHADHTPMNRSWVIVWIIGAVVIFAYGLIAKMNSHE